MGQFERFLIVPAHEVRITGHAPFDSRLLPWSAAAGRLWQLPQFIDISDPHRWLTRCRALLTAATDDS